MTNMYNNRDTPATVEHARSIIRKLEGTKVSELDAETVSRGRVAASGIIKNDNGSIHVKHVLKPGGLFRRNNK